MKVRPETLLINENKPQYKKILVTGSDESLISYVSEHLVKQYKKDNYYIDTTGETDKNLVGDLFSDKKVLFFLKNYTFKKEIPTISENSEQTVLISSSNNKKTSALKGVFLKSNTSLLVDCYPLNRTSKELVLKHFASKNNLELSSDVFWYVLENFENEYVLFVKQLESLSLFSKKVESISDVESVVFIKNKIEINKIFFHIFKKNQFIVNIFNKNIYSQNDFSIFLNTIKLYIGIIRESSNKDVALAKFPKYLFNEKDVFLKIYKNLNSQKIVNIYDNIFKAEKLTRKNSELYNIVGIRLFFKIKKIIIS